MAADVAERTDPRAKLEAIEAEMAQLPQAECPVTHHFTPGLYIRTIFIPKGTLITSAVHKTEHPFVITSGKIQVGSENEGKVTYEAPHMGITRPGTKRLLLALEDTVWTTFHVTEETDPVKIGQAIVEQEKPPGVPAGFVPGYHEQNLAHEPETLSASDDS